MSRFVLRAMQREDWPAVAGIIYASTNAWYQQHARPAIFTCPIDDVQLFCKVYEDLDPGCCILAEDTEKDAAPGAGAGAASPGHASTTRARRTSRWAS